MVFYGEQQNFDFDSLTRTRAQIIAIWCSFIDEMVTTCIANIGINEYMHKFFHILFFFIQIIIEFEQITTVFILYVCAVQRMQCIHFIWAHFIKFIQNIYFF